MTQLFHRLALRNTAIGTLIAWPLNPTQPVCSFLTGQFHELNSGQYPFFPKGFLKLLLQKKNYLIFSPYRLWMDHLNVCMD